MAAEAIKAYADCVTCKTRWKIDAVWDPVGGEFGSGALVVYQQVRPCPLCGGRDCMVGSRVTYETP